MYALQGDHLHTDSNLPYQALKVDGDRRERLDAAKPRTTSGGRPCGPRSCNNKVAKLTVHRSMVESTSERRIGADDMSESPTLRPPAQQYVVHDQLGLQMVRYQLGLQMVHYPLVRV